LSSTKPGFQARPVRLAPSLSPILLNNHLGSSCEPYPDFTY
jgi:hypothetical protein